MCHIYQELSHADIGRQDFNQALEQLHKAQECLLDISSTKEGLAVLSDKLKSYIKGGCSSGDLLINYGFL